MIVYGIASFFDAFPSLSGGIEQEFKWYYIVDLLGWVLLFWAGWQVQKKTLNVKSVFDDRYDYQGENEVPVKTADIEDKKGAEMN